MQGHEFNSWYQKKPKNPKKPAKQGQGGSEVIGHEGLDLIPCTAKKEKTKQQQKKTPANQPLCGFTIVKSCYHAQQQRPWGTAGGTDWATSMEETVKPPEPPAGLDRLTSVSHAPRAQP